MKQPRAWGSFERRTALALFVLAAALIGFFLLRDASSYVNSPQDELLGHVGASAGLTIAAGGVLLVLRERRPSLASLLLLGVGATMVGELAQQFAPTRRVELRDIAIGFAGVLVTGLVIELMLTRISLLRSLRTLTAAAGILSMVLLSLLIIDFDPQATEGSAPDGESCPLTSLTGVGERLIVGAEPMIDARCFVTSLGGFGLDGPANISTFTDETVLLSSPLPELAQRLAESKTLTIRSEIVANFDGTRHDAAGVIALLTARDVGDIVDIRTRDERIEVHGPSMLGTRRGIAWSPGLTAGTRHVIEVTLAGDSMTVHLDGNLISSLVVGDGWADVMTDAQAQDRLTLYLGNRRDRGRPFDGVIEWIEIDAGEA